MDRRAMAACAAVLLAAGAIALSSPAEARTRLVHRQVATGRGVFTQDKTVTRQPGLRTRDAVVTGPNGQSTSVADTRTWSKETGTYTNDKTRTFADGTQRTVDADAQRTAPGQYSYDRTVTTRDGDTRTQSGTVSIDH